MALMYMRNQGRGAI